MTKGKVIRAKFVSRVMVRANQNCLFVFGDNMERRGFGGQAREMRGEPNTLGVPTKWRPSYKIADYFSDADADLEQVQNAILHAFKMMRLALQAGRDVVIPLDGLGTGLADLPRRAPLIHRAIENQIKALEDFASHP